MKKYLNCAPKEFYCFNCPVMRHSKHLNLPLCLTVFPSMQSFSINIYYIFQPWNTGFYPLKKKAIYIIYLHRLSFSRCKNIKSVIFSQCDVTSYIACSVYKKNDSMFFDVEIEIYFRSETGFFISIFTSACFALLNISKFYLTDVN